MVSGSGAIPPLPRVAADGSWSLSARSVIGQDERIGIGDPSAYPWSMICDVDVHLADGGTAQGSGWLAGPDTVITAAHCLHHPSMGGRARAATVLPGRSGTTTPFGRRSGDQFFIPQPWLERGDPRYDFAAVRLQGSFEANPGWFSFAALPDAGLAGQLINIAGYPDDKGGDTQWTHRNRVLLAEERILVYEVDTAEGQSGAPAFLFPQGVDGAPLVVGIHAYGADALAPRNSGPRITEDVFELFRRWLG